MPRRRHPPPPPGAVSLAAALASISSRSPTFPVGGWRRTGPIATSAPPSTRTLLPTPSSVTAGPFCARIPLMSSNSPKPAPSSIVNRRASNASRSCAGALNICCSAASIAALAAASFFLLASIAASRSANPTVSSIDRPSMNALSPSTVPPASSPSGPPFANGWPNSSTWPDICVAAGTRYNPLGSTKSTGLFDVYKNRCSPPASPDGSIDVNRPSSAS